MHHKSAEYKCNYDHNVLNMAFKNYFKNHNKHQSNYRTKLAHQNIKF